MNTLKRIWDFEISNANTWLTNTSLIRLSIWLIAVGFAVFTVLISSVVPGSHSVTIFNIREVIAEYQSGRFGLAEFRAILPYVWMVVAVTAVATRSTITIHSYYLSVQQIGEEKFNRYFSTFILTFLIGTATLILLSAFGWIAVAAGYDADWVGALIANGVEGFNAFVQGLIPFSLNLKSYWLALVLSIFLAYLPGYFVHYLSHHSRLLWLLAHRPHHCPDFLYPLAAPNNNIAILEYLLAIPGVVFFIGISGMIYHEPLTIELAIWFTLALSLESFNHSYAHYEIALKNPFIRNFTRFFGGNGVYHIVHHSAYQQDQNVNFGGAPFLFWDRIFGTYRKPYEHTPPIGLTDQPKIHMSPMKIVFAGFQQIWYEWKMNKSWSARFRILFGGVYYKPPVTKDFLVIASQESAQNPGVA